MITLRENESANFELVHTDDNNEVTVIAHSTSPLPLLRYAFQNGILL